ncbi:hypothetical protein FTUN_0583 [Frigoriglobus tundricola]|uniref:Uncharacterized protein n=1 Tax=Frigoriglobus tundricola TaxID=2774151 RepID=A0A6M5YID8_9BACT|nr:hypothetical protein FTUN_0583 [Frigoriglobus tundricola]
MIREPSGYKPIADLVLELRSRVKALGPGTDEQAGGKRARSLVLESCDPVGPTGAAGDGFSVTPGAARDGRTTSVARGTVRSVVMVARKKRGNRAVSAVVQLVFHRPCVTIRS